MLEESSALKFDWSGFCAARLPRRGAVPTEGLRLVAEVEDILTVAIVTRFRPGGRCIEVGVLGEWERFGTNRGRSVSLWQILRTPLMQHDLA